MNTKCFILINLLIINTLCLFSQQKDTIKVLPQMEVTGEKGNDFGRKSLNGVEDFGIYEGKKTEVIELSKLTGNVATNNARQVFGKIPGLNIWESDGAGIQMGVGSRGLSPNRMISFNTRQNGYDISADAMGYPESYYTPPMEALERIEVVRGAASLQYGTQFGGMMNFIFKQPDTTDNFSFHTRQTAGSFGFLNSFNMATFSSKNNKVAGVAMYQRKQGDGWRPNSRFGVNTAYTDVHFHLSDRLEMDVEYTFFNYLAQQSGGVTDAQFQDNPRQSSRSRNWLAVDWNLPAVGLVYKISDDTKLKVRGFGLVSNRFAVSYQGAINTADAGGKRNLVRGNYTNYGAEARLLHEYLTKNNQKQTLLVGVRWFDGSQLAQQGLGSDGSDANFKYANPERLLDSDFDYDNKNAAVFVEHIFRFSPKFSLTPGIRYEYIKTGALGYYRKATKDAAGNSVDVRVDETMARERSLVLLGIGASWKPNSHFEGYANISQNFRAINFSDLRINNPSLVINPNITDEHGFTADAGVRGNWRNRFNYDISVFSILYKNKIGQVTRADRAPLFQEYRYRTNVSDAYYAGVEAYIEADILGFNKKIKSPHALLLFVSGSVLKAKYFNADDANVKDKNVENAPPLSIRSGLTYHFNQIFKTTFQINHVKEHFSDALNTISTATAVSGIIPSYTVADLSASWNFWKMLSLDVSCNNLFDQRYFTRRAEGNPGPGIIPSDGRAFFVGIDAKF
jgi:Fe(3+) dicitrate transport protein